MNKKDFSVADYRKSVMKKRWNHYKKAMQRGIWNAEGEAKSDI